MPLPKPPYIAQTGIDDPRIRYEWDDSAVLQYCQPEDDEFIDAYANVVRPGVIGLTIAQAEWLVFKFQIVSDDPVPLKYLEAAWCANIDRLYSDLVELDDKDWVGPVRGPLQLAITIINDALYDPDEVDDPLGHASLMSNLVEHVLPDPRPFREWRDRCVERLNQYFRMPEDDPYENLFDEPETILIPREVFDPEFDFQPEMSKELIQRFLAGVDHERNEFLYSPDRMREEGFKGTPYSVF